MIGKSIYAKKNLDTEALGRVNGGGLACADRNGMGSGCTMNPFGSSIAILFPTGTDQNAPMKGNQCNADRLFP